MRFFDTNCLYKEFGGTMAASSATGLASLVFSENKDYAWSSQSQNSDSSQVYVERVLPFAEPINRIFVQNTNIKNLTIQVDIGSGYVNLSSASSFTLTKSTDGQTYFYELNTTIEIIKIKFIGSQTITANQEKYMYQALAFKELGQLKNYSDIQPKRERQQVISKLNSGKADIINKGKQTSFKVKLKSHFNSDDNEIIDLILQRSKEFWIWINDKEQTSMIMIQEPYRFEDIYKVAFQKADSIHFTKNIWYSGVDVEFDLLEVA